MPETKGRKPAPKSGAKRPAKPAAQPRRAAAKVPRSAKGAARPAPTHGPAIPETAAVAPAPPRCARPTPSGPSITILQFASGIGCPKPQRRVLRALGLKHPHHRVVRPDHPSVRGMVAVIPHLVRIVEDTHGA
jgi:large subunit ribosomal protein L30